MPGGLDKYDFVFALVALIVSVHIVGMINHRECAVTVNEISKRCHLPVDVQNFRIRDDELLAAKNLADMENNWVPFKARFNIKDNRLSMQMVRHHSTMNMTSGWRMDPQTDAKGNQWLTMMGRWVGKPLSFEFDQKSFMVNKDSKPVEREEPWFNFKSRTWLGKKVLKQIDLNAVPVQERTVTSYSELHYDKPEMSHVYEEFPKLEQNLVEKTGVKGTVIRDEQTVGRARKSPMKLLPVYPQFSKHQDYVTEDTETEDTAYLEDRLKDGKTADMTKQGVIQLQPINKELPNYEDYMMENTETEATAPSLDDHDKEEQTAETTTQSETKGQAMHMDVRKVEQEQIKETGTRASISKDSHARDELHASKFDQEEEDVNGEPQQPAPSDVKPKVTAKAERNAQARSLPKCPRFPEYNASNVVKNTAVCLPDELSMDECPLDVNEASADTASDGENWDQGDTYEEQSLEPVMGVVDCAWYSPTQVLLGAAAVTTVSVTVATTYVMMVRSQYFWTS